MSFEPSIVNANEERLTALIERARERVVFVAPGVSTTVAEALRQKWQELGPHAVQIVLDVDPEVCRLGYGTLDALIALRAQADMLGTVLCHHPGVRIGLLIADESTIVYSPTPLLVEAGSKQPDRPNAIQLNTSPPELLRDLGLGENAGSERIIGLDAVEKGQIQELEQDLKSNPPVKFDLARKVRVFTSKFQFVELAMTGIYISRKKVPIPSSLVGLAHNREVQSQFHAHFNLVNQAKLAVKRADETVLTEGSLHEMRQDIMRDYLIPLKGYGMVVLRANKGDLVKRVEELREKISAFQGGVRESLQDQMDANIKALVDALLPAVIRNPPTQYTKCHGANIPESKIERMLTEDIQHAFGDAGSLAQDMNVSLVFKDVTYESLNDPKFLEIAKRAIPELERLHEEYDAAEPAKED